LSSKPPEPFHGCDLKTREADVIFSAKILLAKHYNLVMMTYSFRRLAPRLVTAAAMKWMKWKGRSPVERAAASTFPDLRRRFA
jgi:hypothetical protein